MSAWKTRWNGGVVIGCFALIAGAAAHAQGRGGNDWTTAGNDAQRSSWVRTDAKISSTGMAKPGFALLWKQKLNNDARLNSLTSAVLMDRYIGYRGFRALGYVGGSNDTVTALDTDLGRVEWTKKLSNTLAPAGTLPCPGGLTSALTRPTSTVIQGPPAGRGGFGGGRGGPAKSAVGDAEQGAVTLAAAAAPPANRGGANPPADAAGGRGRGGAGGTNVPRERPASYVYALSSDGKLHAMYVSNGEEPNPAIPFIPANANASGLIVVDNVAYVATSNGCGGVPNGVWALDLASKEVTSWKASGNIAGTAGPAFGPYGTLYIGTDGGDLVALEAKTLKQSAIYKGGTAFVTSPVVFELGDKVLIAIMASNAALHVVTPQMTNTLTAPSAASDPSPTSLSSWQDGDGTRWLLTAGAKAVTAWKVVDKGGVPSVEQGWVSRDMVAPLPPMVVNGIVFAVSSGEAKGIDPKTVAQKSGKAVLYALDGKTGKELWNSGPTITSFVHGGNLAGGSSQMYLTTQDGTLYAFGFPIEH